jgi:outer membrane protein assembly factor BamB
METKGTRPLEQFKVNFISHKKRRIFIMTTLYKMTSHAIFASSISLGLSLFMTPPCSSQVAGKQSTKAISLTGKVSNSTSKPIASTAGSSSNASGGATVKNVKIEVSEQTTKSGQSIVGRYTGSWSMFLQNPCRTGQASGEVIYRAQGKIKWIFPAEGPIDSSPAIIKGVVYVGSDDGHVYALDEATGRMLWRTRLGDKVKSSPAFSNGKLVVGCEDKKIYCLNASTGKILWSVATQDRVSASPAIHENTAYVGSWDGNVYAIDIASGTIKWQFPGQGNAKISQETPLTEAATKAKAEPDKVVAIDNAALAVADSANTAPANTPVSAAVGAKTLPTPITTGRITSSPCLGPGVVLISCHNGHMYCLSMNDGSLLWQFRTGGRLMASPMILDHTAYLGSWDHALYAVDLTSGKQKWRVGAPESFSITATGANGRIFAGNDDLKMYCFDAHSGKLIWKTAINSPVPLLSSAPAIAGGMLYCGSPDTNVYAIDTRNGAIKWKLKTQRPIVSSPALSNSGVIIGSQDGNLYCIQ